MPNGWPETGTRRTVVNDVVASEEERPVIKHEEARQIISAAVRKAEEIGQPMNIAVMDAGRNLLAFERMDGAWVASIDIAIDKAFTSAGRGLSTRKIGEMAQPGQPLFGINTTNGGRIVIFAGGLPLVRDGEVVGAIGVSGGSVDQDEEAAEAGVAAFQ
ncbi:MAG TPA: heme-binding protein [Rubrobacteraceae bacterium]|nr:heme-binding protein [Rubrobacteraceae bacterium]